MARLLAHLVRGVLLRARVEEDVAQVRREAERALLAVEQVRDRPARALVGEVDALPLVEPIPDGGVRLDDEAEGQDRLVRGPRRREVDVVRILRVPEVLLGARDDLLEVRGAPRVAGGIEHRREVVGEDRLVGGIDRHFPGSYFRGPGESSYARGPAVSAAVAAAAPSGGRAGASRSGARGRRRGESRTP